jgi:glycosyltransferase involved in cell wall biosynthesis
MNKKVLLFANTDWYLYNFRLSLAERLRNEGWEVVLVSPGGEYGNRLVERGFRWISFDFSIESTNPFRDIQMLIRLISLYKREQPSLVHHFTIKCVIYGSLAARIVGGIQVANAVTGLGHVFTDTGIKISAVRPIVRLLYRLALSMKNMRVIFQNTEDRDAFLHFGLVKESFVRIIRGSGVNCERFHPDKNSLNEKDGVVKILFASRLLKEKGIHEFIEAAHISRRKEIPVDFLLAGDIYPENPSSLNVEDIESIKKQEIVSYLGHRDDMEILIGDSDIVVLPSYREGTPRVLVEAAAMEKPVVATDIAGCSGIVQHQVNGLLVPVKDPEALAEALELLVKDQQLRDKYGKAGRQIVLKDFEENTVINKTLDVYHELIS